MWPFFVSGCCSVVCSRLFHSVARQVLLCFLWVNNASCDLAGHVLFIRPLLDGYSSPVCCFDFVRNNVAVNIDVLSFCVTMVLFEE